MYVSGILRSANLYSSHTFGRTPVGTEKALLLTIWFLGNTESYRQISERFDVTRSCAYNVIRKVINYLVSISDRYICWPKDEDEEPIVEGLRNKQGIHGVRGAIDCSHIKINKPQLHQEAYCNRKGDHSIILQAVVDHQKIFSDVFCGEASSIHDARTLKRSSLYEKACNGEILTNTFLLGDSAYPSLTWLVPPFKDNGNLSQNQKNFNNRHSSTRVIIENAFALQKGRFRRLKFFENLHIKFIVQCVVAACVLHNICINRDDLDINYEDIEMENDQPDAPNINLDEYGINYDKRQEIFNEMFH